MNSIWLPILGAVTGFVGATFAVRRPRINPTQGSDLPVFLDHILNSVSANIVTEYGAEFLPRPDAPLIGSGSFGFVLRTKKSGVILKITCDGSEAFLATALRSRKALRGLPSYVVDPLTIERGGEPLWLIWSKEVNSPRLDVVHREMQAKLVKQFPLDLSTSFEGEQNILERKAIEGARIGIDDFARLEAMHQVGLSFASAMIAGKITLSEAQRSLVETMPWARDRFEPKDKGWFEGWSYASGERRMSSREISAIHLLAYEYHLKALAKGKMLPTLAGSCLSLLEDGIVICDIQEDNISGSGADATLFDGGFTLPIDSKWNRLWSDLQVRTDRWFRHKSRDIAWEAWA